MTASGAGGSASATSLGRLVTFETVQDPAGDIRQIGPGILDFFSSAKVSRASGKGAIGTYECTRALATSCTVEVSGTVKIGLRTYPLLKTTATISESGKVGVSLPKQPDASPRDAHGHAEPEDQRQRSDRVQGHREHHARGPRRGVSQGAGMRPRRPVG